jgi:hypothetical protein
MKILAVDAAIRREISPSTIEPVWIRHRCLRPSVGGRKRRIGTILGNAACKHAPYHFDVMSYSREDGTRRCRRVHFDPENPISQVGQSVVRKDFGFDIDAVRCADAEARVKPPDVDFNQRQRICRALLAWTRLSGYLFKSRQQCDVSVHDDIRPSHFEKRAKDPAVFWKRMTNAAGDGEFQEILIPADILKRRFPATDTGDTLVPWWRAAACRQRVSQPSASQHCRPIPPAGSVLPNRHSCSAGEAVDLPCGARQVVRVARKRYSRILLFGKVPISPT